MNIPIEIKKAIAENLMNKLDIYKPYINGFKKENKICFYENFGGFWVDEEPELADKIKEFEKEHNALVYAATHEYTDFGECYDFLIIPDYEEDLQEILIADKQNFIAFAYVWNKTHDYCSEFGRIVIKPFGGGIKRIA